MQESRPHRLATDIPLTSQGPLQHSTTRGLPARGPGSRIRRALTKRQVVAIRDALRHLGESDLVRGRLAGQRRYCDACEGARPAAGFVEYGRYSICNRCAIEFEVASARGLPVSVGRFVRDKNFGETGCYSLESLLME